MARIAGVDLPRDKRIEVALTRVHGVGNSRSRDILEATQVDRNTKVHNLTEEELVKLREYINSNYKVEGDLQREVSQNVKRLMEIGCYRGIRHKRGLPVRGQRTHTNARTRKGPRRTAGGKRSK